MAIGEYLTTDDVATELNISAGRVRQFVVEGRLKYFKKIGQVLFFDPDEVQKFKQTPRNPGRPKSSA